MAFTPRILAALGAGWTALAGTMASAQAIGELEIVGAPVDRGIGFQPAVTELARDLQWLDGLILVIITAITLFVTGLLVWCILRYNKRANAVAARFSHNTPIEVTWTIVPIVILVFIGAFSLPVLFKQQEIPEPDLTIKATGYQWYWGYEYPEQDLAFESYMIGYGSNEVTDEIRAELEANGYTDAEFRLATDTAVVVPVNKTVVIQVTGADVIHAWAMPAFGVKQDGVPGRLAELWFKAEREGVYFGQCSELCGKDHSYMPITVKVVSEEVWEAWLAEAAQLYSSAPRQPEVIQVAAN